MCEDDYEYDYDYDYDGDEPDYYEEELTEFRKVIVEFIQNYVNKPINRKTFHLLNEVYKKFEGIYYPFERGSLRKHFISDTVNQIENKEYKKKFLTEAFLYQFKGLNLETEPTKFLKIMYDNDTYEFAKMFYKNDLYPFIMKFILEVVSSMDKSTSYSPSKISSSKYQTDDHEDEYGYSHVLYWEAVHDGDIVPEDYLENDSNHFDGYDDFDSYYSYDRDDSRDYTDSERVAQKLEKYIRLLEEETPFFIPINEVEPFLEKFKKHVYTAESLLSDIKVKEQIDSIFGELVSIGREAGLEVLISKSFDKKINFDKKNGKRYLEVTLFKPVKEKSKDWNNDFSLYIDNIKKNININDLKFVISVLQVIGYDVDDRYIDFVYEVLKKDHFFGKNTIMFNSGLSIEAINHGDELRQFLKW
ncbi:hypothetical protein AA0X95_20245 [Bacillus sp. 1P10SD]|uniref:hypothetical protein n=1 Tax=Bacillus sp. 1P10SD TaxID=3132265 RepID=UPI0039A74100